MFDPANVPGTGLFQIGLCISADCAANGSERFRLSGFDSLVSPPGSDAFLTGWTGTDAGTGEAISTATCRGAGFFTDGIDFATVAGIAPSGRIDFLDLDYGVGTASLTCRGADFGTNGWRIADAWG